MNLRDRAWQVLLRLTAGVFVLNPGLRRWGADEETAKQLHGFASGAYPFLRNVEPPLFAKALSVSEVGHRCRARARGPEGAVTAGYRVPGRVMDPHVASIRDVVPRTPHGCDECLRMGTPWVHLRLCLTCGHVGCCDSSPMRHARARAGVLGHPIVQSMEPGENWRWCYVDGLRVTGPQHREAPCDRRT